MAREKRPPTQRQLESLAKTNPVIAKRLKEGYYNDRIREPGAPSPGKRRSRPASIPDNPGPPAAKTRKRPAASGSKPGSSRTSKRSSSGKKPGSSGSSSGNKGGGGFLRGLLGGG